MSMGECRRRCRAAAPRPRDILPPPLLPVDTECRHRCRCRGAASGGQLWSLVVMWLLTVVSFKKWPPIAGVAFADLMRFRITSAVGALSHYVHRQRRQQSGFLDRVLTQALLPAPAHLRLCSLPPASQALTVDITPHVSNHTGSRAAKGGATREAHSFQAQAGGTFLGQSARSPM